jgi:MoaA/NifB/PqqE/SkfB family radical SAM enzyme
MMKYSTLDALTSFFLFSKKRPSYLLLFVTSRCNASCGHCFYWQKANRKEHELTVGEIEQLAKSLGNMLQITLTGGSPELRDDLADIAIVLARICKPVNMTLSSNGSMPEKLFAAVTNILDHIPDLNLTVDISLDGLFEEHDDLRKFPGLFNKVRSSFNMLAVLKKKHSGLRLGMGLCVSGLNQNTAEKTALWAIDNLPIDNLTPILIRGEPRNPSALECDPDVFLKIAQIVEQRLYKDKFRGYAAFPAVINAKDIVQKQLIADIARTKRSCVRCSACRETAVVYPDGAVPGCEIRREIIGNLRTVNMNISELWKSKSAADFRNKIKTEKCFCWHQCFLSALIIKSPKLWAKLLYTIWKLWRRSVGPGVA